MIGIIGAMKIEVDALKNRITDQTVRMISGVEYVSGYIGAHEVVVAQCGIGKVFAALCAQTMILTYHPTVLVNTGVAGTLSETLSIGDVAVSSAVVQHDMDTSALGDPPGMISGLDIIQIPADQALAEKVKQCVEAEGLHCEIGVIASGDQFIADREKKAYIQHTFHAVACEMEGAAIGHTAYVNGVGFVVIRAISDGANDDSSMDFPAFCKHAAEHSVQVTLRLLDALAEK